MVIQQHEQSDGVLFSGPDVSLQTGKSYQTTISSWSSVTLPNDGDVLFVLYYSNSSLTVGMCNVYYRRFNEAQL